MPIEIKLPTVTADFEAGAISAWHKKEGEQVTKGDVLIDVETDKALVEVEAPESGVLGKILCPAGSEAVPVNTVIGLLLAEGESEASLDNYTGGKVTPESLPMTEKQSPSQTFEQARATTSPSQRLLASPLARRVAEQLNVDLNGVQGRGPNGRILKADVELAASSAPVTAGFSVASSSEQDYTLLPNSAMRKVIAQRLSESKQTIPHFYLTVDCEIDALLALRQKLNQRSPESQGAYKVSVNDFIIKACAMAMRDIPAANVSWSDDALRQYHTIDIAVAVATPGGLITPIVRDADTKGLVTIANEVKDLAVRAREGKLAPQEYQGGGFSISNLGMYGIKQFSAIINPPQSCILAVGAGEQRPVVKDGELQVATVMSCTLSVDHRSVDGAVGAEFLQAIKTYIEDPLALLLAME